ncbi:MAG: metalloregulator ArsR/SmtB family transcription factor [Actinomycetota bacterium]|nr:metalloregulator ArsR/SmtB family transcription factor [Actinomycetota bacterium]
MTATHEAPAELTVALRALVDPNRRRVFEQLRRSEECVTSLAEQLGMTAALVSHHLHALMGADFVQERHHGPWRCYSLVPETLKWLRGELDGLLDPTMVAAARPGANPCAPSPEPVGTKARFGRRSPQLPPLVPTELA